MTGLTLERRVLLCAICGRHRREHSRKRPGYIPHRFVKEKP